MTKMKINIDSPIIISFVSFLYFQSLLQFRMDGLTVENKKADI